MKIFTVGYEQRAVFTYNLWLDFQTCMKPHCGENSGNYLIPYALRYPVSRETLVATTFGPPNLQLKAFIWRFLTPALRTIPLCLAP